MSPIYARFHLAAITMPEKLALHDGEQRYTYKQLLQRVDSLALYILSTSGKLRPRAALITNEQIDNVCVSIALAKVGGCCIPMSAHLLPTQIQAACLAVDANMVIGKQLLLDKLVGDTGLTRLLTDDFNERKALDCSTAFGKECQQQAEKLEIDEWLLEDDFLITLSSGSTGQPKPIMISQAVKLARAEQTWALYLLSSNDTVLCASPFFHSLGQRLTFVPLLLGASLVHLSRFTPLAWLNLVAEQKVSFVIAVSSHLYALKNSLISNAAALQNLRTIVTSSAPIDAGFKAQVFNAIGCDFYEIYGATEIAVATNLVPADAKYKYQTVGLPCDNVDLQIIDSKLQVVDCDVVGQIAVKSPLSFTGYYGKTELTAASIERGYFLTGDIGSMDKQGFVTYVGRQKDVIISGGINIYPKDIETELLRHPELNEVAVIGVEDSLLGEVIVAVCITEIGEELETPLRRLSNKNLASFQRPLKYFFPKSLPLTPTGKVSKLLLRDEYSKLNQGWTDMLRVMLYGE
ncbi:class I adenylate-forming enzyme family protein [Shewanella sp. 6_MG-2023]|uniref:class I adenylate-forming enzyme family protein n=1 Tax=Shewanella sp. 6_MG-2023 TaxID=3062660 RepID=UPI0026E29C66|nr:class I adenylate-forming enzyme family protein [Shewanella sp. 6_MG-2023]MDO6618569.1 class I adenylate-forming enzyme family protein [Shewanella sp. 6_MG-2023]